jgi:hypothetical protein
MRHKPLSGFIYLKAAFGENLNTFGESGRLKARFRRIFVKQNNKNISKSNEKANSTSKRKTTRKIQTN